MILTSQQSLVIIAVIALGTILTRGLPFLLFPSHKETPAFILYLGQVIPPGCSLWAAGRDCHRVYHLYSSVEKQCAAQHRRRNGALYGPGAIRVCLRPSAADNATV